MKNPIPTIQGLGRSREFQNWTLFCLFIFLLKVLLFALDPLPKFIMGDSGSYIQTALTGWIPEDRSFLYGYVIRWISVSSRSLSSLLIVQVSLSAVSSVIFAWICHFIFQLPTRWAYLFGFLCALDPLQLLYERYVMTEAISLSLYVFVIHHSFLYLKQRRVRHLVVVQIISVLLIGFRMSFLLLVEINTVILPFIAFSPQILKRFHRPQVEGVSMASAFRIGGLHLLLSLILMVLMHDGYRRTNGWLANRKAAYLHTTGMTLLAFWAPVLQPEDSDDGRLADLIRRGDEVGLKNPAYRNMQLYTPDMLLDRLSKVEPEPSEVDRLARTAALHALRRDPIGVAGLTWHTYAEYWRGSAMKQFAEKDFSFGNPPGGDLIGRLAFHFHLAHNNTSNRSFVQEYYVAAWPYYFLILLAPLLSGLVLLIGAGRRYGILLFIHISVMLVMAMTFGSETIRFLQPISFMTLLAIALGASALPLAGKRPQETAPV